MIKKALGAISGDPETEGKVLALDVIEHEGKHWLVGGWLESSSAGLSIPTRLILLDLIPHGGPGPNGMDFVLYDPIPKAVLDGTIPPELSKRYVVIERPDIKLRIPARMN